jgi:HEAT repeat protein
MRATVTRRCGAPLLLLWVLAASAVVDAEPRADGLAAEAVAALGRLTADPDRGVRYAAVQALGKSGASAETLAPALADRDRVVRREAAWWLRRRGEAALGPLTEAFASDDPSVRATVAWALSEVGPSALPLLRRALGDPVLQVRVEALRSARLQGPDAVRPLADELVARATSPDVEEAFEAARTLVEGIPERAGAAVPGILAGLRKGLLPRSDALEMLLRAGPPGEPALAELAKDGSVASRLQWLRTRDVAPRPAPDVPADAPVDAPGLARAPVAERLGEWERSLRDGPVLARIRAAVLVGEARAPSETVAPALDDPERDVRAAAAAALATTRGDDVAIAALRRALSDSNWRVRLAALESLGARGAGADGVAPFLADPHPAVSFAAARALGRIGPAAAVPTAAQTASGHYGVLHYAPEVLSHAGSGGAAAVARLVALLEHADPNVRETAARCLFEVGSSAAAPALARALEDDRLCVVSHAALALGRAGLSRALLDTLSHPRARVRAYGAFAVGWALGAAHGIDQVPFEVRMPVLDVGAKGPFPTRADLESLERTVEAEREETGTSATEPRLSSGRRRALWAPDPEVSSYAARNLDYAELDARESERVMELLLPEGFRRGSGVDLDHVREIVGSSELPALLSFLMLSGPTSPPRGDVYGALHRTSRADNLPAIYWFHRNDARALRDEPDGEIHMPATRTVEPLRVGATLMTGSDPGPDRDEILRALLREEAKDARWGLRTPALWLLNEWTPRTPEDVRLVLRVALAVEGPHALRSGAARIAALRALGRCTDRASEAHLRRVAAEETEAEPRAVAVSALARRGDPAALTALIEASRTAPLAQVLLLEVAPRTFAETLAERLARAGDEHDVAAAFDPEWPETATRLGVRVESSAFWGVEAEVARRVSDPAVLGAAAVSLPTCRTRRLGERLFEAIAASDWPRIDEEEGWSGATADAVVAFLHSVDPERLLREMRSLSEVGFSRRGTWARSVLLRLGDRESAEMLFRWIREEDPEDVYVDWIERFGGPEAVEYFRGRLADDPESAVASLARLSGWPRWAEELDLDAYPRESRAEIRDAVRRGDVETALRRHPRAAVLADPLGPPTPVWRRLAIAALRGDATARGALWSGLRAGRLRWIHTTFEDELQTMGHDPSLLPHWLSDLDSNCCRVSDGMAVGTFERPYGVPHLYGSEVMGVGEPLSRRARSWLELAGAGWVRTPLPDSSFFRAPDRIPSPE